jgi:hypothetical protein
MKGGVHLGTKDRFHREKMGIGSFLEQVLLSLKSIWKEDP